MIASIKPLPNAPKIIYFVFMAPRRKFVILVLAQMRAM